MEYASLLALLEFVDTNPKVFDGKALEISGDSMIVVHQVNERLSCRRDLENFQAAALLLKRRIPYTLDWVPLADNPAAPHSLSH
jgi:hypothetical protein